MRLATCGKVYTGETSVLSRESRNCNGGEIHAQRDRASDARHGHRVHERQLKLLSKLLIDTTLKRASIYQGGYVLSWWDRG